MKQILPILTLSVLTLFGSCGPSDKSVEKSYTDISDFHPSDTLFRIHQGEWYELGTPCGYVNQKRDTVIAIGKYAYCFLDTVTTYAIVADQGKSPPEIYAIDQFENRLYEVYWYDNGPDYLEDGRFRIKRNGKIGYADRHGKIVIEPQFDCANQFEDGKAKVTFDCDLIAVNEHTEMKSDHWFYIDKRGKEIK